MSSRRTRDARDGRGPPLNFKAVLLGEGCVGKTSLVLRYSEDKFNSQHISTLQASFVTKKVTLADERRAQLNIWDTAGQERFHALGPIYYRGSDGALLVYDITDHDSFQKVKSWVRELKQMRGSDIALIIVGNKTDLEEQRAVVYDKAMQYARTVGASYLETSAKENEGVSEVFDLLTQLMAEHHRKRIDDPQALRLESVSADSNSTSAADSFRQSLGSSSSLSSSPPRERGPSASAHRSCCGI